MADHSKFTAYHFYFVRVDSQSSTIYYHFIHLKPVSNIFVKSVLQVDVTRTTTVDDISPQKVKTSHILNQEFGNR